MVLTEGRRCIYRPACSAAFRHLTAAPLSTAQSNRALVQRTPPAMRQSQPSRPMCSTHVNILEAAQCCSDTVLHLS